MNRNKKISIALADIAKNNQQFREGTQKHWKEKKL
jgi:hypothetical protein